MFKLIAVIINELTLLWRDKSGLLVLFMMPAALVLVITLVQENVLKTVGESEISVLYVDHDRQIVGKEVKNKLSDTGALNLDTVDAGQPVDPIDVKSQVLRGDFQVGIIIPAGLTDSLQRRAGQSIKRLMESESDRVDQNGPIPSPPIEIYFDPTVMGGVRSAIGNALNAVLLGIEIKAQLKAFSDQLPHHLEKHIETQLGAMVSEGLIDELPAFDFKLSDTRLLAVTEINPAESGLHVRPTSVQQNVPAWALFGIFFIAVPIAGSLIKERKNGTYRRLLSFPVSPMALLVGKMTAYMVVGLAQLVLIGLIGRFVLPLLGTPVLDMGASPLGILLMAFSSILAAAGYGVLLGTLGSTYEQVSMLGPITIVIAAAIGGIMVPVYAMPAFMQALSHLSPLAWGLNGFLDLFVREGSARVVLPWAFFLLVFCAACLVVSWLFFFRRLASNGN